MKLCSMRFSGRRQQESWQQSWSCKMYAMPSRPNLFQLTRRTGSSFGFLPCRSLWQLLTLASQGIFPHVQRDISSAGVANASNFPSDRLYQERRFAAGCCNRFELWHLSLRPEDGAGIANNLIPGALRWPASQGEPAACRRGQAGCEGP